MSPPIGSARAGVVSQVGNDLPDSVVSRYVGADYTQGDNTWSADVGSDMSITGDPQTGTIGSEDSVRGDGIDDVGKIPMPSELNGSDLTSFAIEFSFAHSDKGDKFTAIGLAEDNFNQKIQLNMNSDPNGGGTDGHFTFDIEDDAGNRLKLGPNSNPNLDDGNRHTILVDVIDSTTDNVIIYIDGSSVSTTTKSADGPNNFKNWTLDCGVWARTRSDSPTDNYGDIGIGEIKFHKTDIGSPTID